MINTNNGSSSFQKHQQLENPGPSLHQGNHNTHFSAENHVPKASATVTASASPPLTAKTNLPLPAATAEKWL